LRHARVPMYPTEALKMIDRVAASAHARTAFLWIVSSVAGFVLAWLAWGPDRTPGLSLLLPVCWVFASSRTSAWLLTSSYHLGVTRFLPDFAGRWFESTVMGWSFWLAMGALCGLAWAISWTKRRDALAVSASWLGVLVLTLVPPFAMVLPGHPVVALGYVVPGAGWVGVGGYFVGMGLLLILARRPGGVSSATKAGYVRLVVGVAMAGFIFIVGDKPEPSAGKVVGKIGALETHWGGFPKRDSLEVVQRIVKIGRASRSLVGGEGEISTLVVAESVLGVYDPSLYPVLDIEVLKDMRTTGQSLVVGADIFASEKVLQKAALAFRADGSSGYVVARQPVPVAEWAPWGQAATYDLDWTAVSVLNIGGGVKARIMFCYEEYIPMLHLISEAREEQHMVVVMANLWAASDPLANEVQAAHTEGMAKLFRRPWVRAVNFPAR